MTDLHAIAANVLTAHSLEGDLMAMSPGRWLLRGLRGRNGAAAEIEGEPDEAILNQAADQIVAALSEEIVGR